MNVENLELQGSLGVGTAGLTSPKMKIELLLAGSIERLKGSQ